jgi:hypothetical protein
MDYAMRSNSNARDDRPASEKEINEQNQTAYTNEGQSKEVEGNPQGSPLPITTSDPDVSIHAQAYR